jgi:hypothetical protein
LPSVSTQRAVLEMRDELRGFDLDLTGFDCIGDIVEPWDLNLEQPWSCPFKPGCGAKTPRECAAAKQLAKILPAPERVQ